LSGCFFPPNDRAQNHAQENPLLELFLLAQNAKYVKICKKIYTFLNRWIIWEAERLEISELSGRHQKFCPET
jgi:hypothetical protein